MKPHPLFDTEWYLRQNRDVRLAGMPALQHYVQYGWKEGRNPHPLFDTAFYLSNNPDVAEAGVDPLLHYIERGWREGRDPHPLFDSDWYLENNPDVAEAGVNPLLHYVERGWREGRDPSARFCVTNYRQDNPDVATIEPLQHYWEHGRKKRRPVRLNAAAIGFRKRIKLADQAVRAQRWDEALRQWNEVARDDRIDNPTFCRARTNVSILRRLCKIDSYREAIERYRVDVGESPPRIAVYTAIIGGYDLMRLPETLDQRLKYVLFTDRAGLGSGVWEERTIGDKCLSDNRRTARYVKTHPHELLRDFDVAVWIDANITIVRDIYVLVDEFLKSKKAVGAVPHPHRNNIFQEVEACIEYRKDDVGIMRRQVEKYRETGFEHADLIESGLMMFDLTAPKTAAFLDSWWKEIEQHSARDQLSLNYCLAKHGISWHRLMNRPQSVRNHPIFAFWLHEKPDDGLSAHLVAALAGSGAQARPAGAGPAAGRRGRNVVQFTPAKTGNPYYMLIPAALRERGCDIQCTNEWPAVESCDAASLILHFHQLEPFYHAATIEQTRDAAKVLLNRLERLCSRGARIVLTWHNPYPHDRRYLEVDHWLYERLNPLVSRVIVHLATAKPFVAHFIDGSKIDIVPHPSLQSYYGDPLERTVARASLKLAPDAYIFASVGSIKAYKGIDTLAAAWQKVQATAPHALLLIGGHSADADLPRRIAGLPNVRLTQTFLADAEVRLWLSAADAAVFAHKAIWTSGSAILAMSYGLPVIMPDSRHTRQYIADENNGFLYAQNDDGALGASMLRAIDSDFIDHIRLTNRAFAKSITPAHAAEQIAAIYDSIA